MSATTAGMSASPNGRIFPGRGLAAVRRGAGAEHSMSAVIADQPAPSKAVAALLNRAPRLFIGNEWVESAGDATIPVVDPALGRRIATVADACEEDVERAVRAARRALAGGQWPELLPAERQALIWSLADLTDRHADQPRELAGREHGRP